MTISLQISLTPDRVVVWRHVGPFVRIGRDRLCELRFRGARHIGVSRKHAQIEFRLDGAYLIDTASRNGTFHNGGPVTTCVLLKPGDQIRLGRTGPQLTVRAIVQRDDERLAANDPKVAASSSPPACGSAASIEEINRRFEDDLARIMARIAAHHAAGKQRR